MVSENFKRLDNFKLPQEFFREHFVDVTLTFSYKDLLHRGINSHTLFWDRNYSHYFDKFFFVGNSPDFKLRPSLGLVLPLEDFNDLDYLFDNFLANVKTFDILISEEISSEFLLRWK